MLFIKAEMIKKDEADFNSKFLKWIAEREEGDREPVLNPNKSLDPGRIHEDVDEYIKLKDSDDPLDKIRFAIKDAKKNR